MKNILDISDFFSEFLVINDSNQDLYIDMHLHTIDSDGSITPEQIANFLQNKNYLIAVADHNEISAIKKLYSLGIHAVPAIELGCEDGFELLVYFKTIEDAEKFYSSEVVPFRHSTRMSRTTRDVFTYLEILKNYNVHISIPHINGMAQKNFLKNKKYIFKIIRSVDSLETHNHSLQKNNNKVAFQLKRIYNKTESWGSDAHTLAEMGSYFNFLHKRQNFAKSLYYNLNKVKVISSIGVKHLSYMIKTK